MEPPDIRRDAVGDEALPGATPTAPIHVALCGRNRFELGNGSHQRVVRGHELGADIGLQLVSQREDAASDAVTCLQDGDAEAELPKSPRAREPGEPRADDDHVPPLRTEPERHSRGGAEELAARERQGKRSYADSVRNSTNSSARATSSNTSRAVSCSGPSVAISSASISSTRSRLIRPWRIHCQTCEREIS